MPHNQGLNNGIEMEVQEERQPRRQCLCPFPCEDEALLPSLAASSGKAGPGPRSHRVNRLTVTHWVAGTHRSSHTQHCGQGGVGGSLEALLFTPASQSTSTRPRPLHPHGPHRCVSPAIPGRLLALTGKGIPGELPVFCALFVSGSSVRSQRRLAPAPR